MSFESSLYIPDTSLWQIHDFASIFPQSLVYLFIHFIVPSKEQKFLILMISSISFFSFIDPVFCVLSLRRHCFTQNHKDFAIGFLLEVLKILGYIFKPMIHFELILVFGVRYRSTFLLFFAYRHLIILSLLNCICALVEKWYMCGSIFWVCSAPLTDLSILMPVSHSINYCSLILSVKVR